MAWPYLVWPNKQPTNLLPKQPCQNKTQSSCNPLRISQPTPPLSNLLIRKKRQRLANSQETSIVANTSLILCTLTTPAHSGQVTTCRVICTLRPAWTRAHFSWTHSIAGLSYPLATESGKNSGTCSLSPLELTPTIAGTIAICSITISMEHMSRSLKTLPILETFISRSSSTCFPTRSTSRNKQRTWLILMLNTTRCNSLSHWVVCSDPSSISTPIHPWPALLMKRQQLPINSSDLLSLTRKEKHLSGRDKP